MSENESRSAERVSFEIAQNDGLGTSLTAVPQARDDKVLVSLDDPWADEEAGAQGSASIALSRDEAQRLGEFLLAWAASVPA